MGPTFPFVFVDTTHTFGMQPFGFMVGLGIVIAEDCAAKRAKTLGYDPQLFRSFFFWITAVGLTLSHMIDAVFYHPSFIAKNPLFLFKIWDGLSSFGGFIGAIVGALGWKYLTFPKGSFVPARRPKALPILPFDEVAMAAFPISFTLGRVGCALVHDHPGMLTTPGAPFAVAWPLDENDGFHHVFGPLHVVWGSTTRYDLGLLELLFLVPFTLAIMATWNKRFPLGTYTAVVALVYSPVRFALDFLRVKEGDEGDIRYGALTFAQYACIAFFALGLYVAWKIHASKKEWGKESEEAVRAKSSVPSGR